MLHFYTPQKYQVRLRTVEKKIGESWNGWTKPYENIFTTGEG